jgi:hypothetical protein
MIKIKDSSEFNRLLEALSRDIVDSNIHIRLYKDLSNALKANSLVYAQSPTFWSLTLEAHWQTCIYRLCRVYDQENNSLHLKNWLLKIKENLHLFDEVEFRTRLSGNPFVDSLAENLQRPDRSQLEKDISECSDSDPQVKILTIHRNNKIAHTGARNVVAEKDIGDDHPLTLENVEELLLRAEKILNRYSSLFAANIFSTLIIGHDDFQYIISCVEKAVKMDRKLWGN